MTFCLGPFGARSTLACEEPKHFASLVNQTGCHFRIWMEPKKYRTLLTTAIFYGCCHLWLSEKMQKQSLLVGRSFLLVSIFSHTDKWVHSQLLDDGDSVIYLESAQKKEKTRKTRIATAATFFVHPVFHIPCDWAS